jgi:hypothetical protein
MSSNPGAVRAIDPFRDDALASELTRLFKNDPAVVLEVLVVQNAVCRAHKQALELRLSLAQRQAPAIVPV